MIFGGIEIDHLSELFRLVRGGLKHWAILHILILLILLYKLNLPHGFKKFKGEVATTLFCWKG